MADDQQLNPDVPASNQGTGQAPAFDEWTGMLPQRPPQQVMNTLSDTQEMLNYVKNKLGPNYSPVVDNVVKSGMNAQKEAQAQADEIHEFNENIKPENFEKAPIDIAGQDIDQYVKATKNAQDARIAELDADRQKLAEGKLDPDHYWHDKTLFQRLMTASGVAMGAYGQALTGGGSNVALEMFNRAADRDWEAQKLDMNKLVQLHNMASQDVEQVRGQQAHDFNVALQSDAMKYANKLSKLNAFQAYMEQKAKEFGPMKEGQQFAQTAAKAQEEKNDTYVKLLEAQKQTAVQQAQLEAQYMKTWNRPLSPRLQTSLTSYPQALQGIEDYENALKSGKVEAHPVIGNIPVIGQQAMKFSPANTQLEQVAANVARARNLMPSAESMKRIRDSELPRINDPQSVQLEKIKQIKEKLQQEFQTTVKANNLYQHVPNYPGAERFLKTPAQAQPEAQAFKEGQTATNPNTGERLIFKGGKWQPMQ